MLEMPPVAIVMGSIEGEMDGADGDDKAASTISVVVVWREAGMEEIGRGVDCGCA